MAAHSARFPAKQTPSAAPSAQARAFCRFGKRAL
jgi:hypothetical protein